MRAALALLLLGLGIALPFLAPEPPHDTALERWLGCWRTTSDCLAEPRAP